MTIEHASLGREEPWRIHAGFTAEERKK